MHFRSALILTAALSFGLECLAANVDVAPAWKYLMQGTAELDATHFQKGEELLSKAIETDPKSAVALVQRGRCYYRLEKFTHAISDFNRALALHPGLKLSIQALKYKTTSVECIKDWKQMLTDCNQLIKLNPYEPFAYSSRAKAYKNLGEEALSKKDLRTVQMLAPRNQAYWQATNMIKSESAGQSRFDAALRIMNQHLKGHPYDGEAYFQRAGINSQLGKMKETMADYDACIKYTPDRFLLNADRARFLTELKRYKEAIVGYTDALELAPGNDHLMLDRAACYMHLGDYANSIKDYTALSALHPDDEDPLHFRARVYVLTKQYTKALYDYDRVIYMAPDQAANYSERSKVYEKLGKHDLAVKDADKASALLNGPIR
jgi:tetratricopeptide (TPR) repeat protein